MFLSRRLIDSSILPLFSAPAITLHEVVVASFQDCFESEFCARFISLFTSISKHHPDQNSRCSCHVDSSTHQSSLSFRRPSSLSMKSSSRRSKTVSRANSSRVSIRYSHRTRSTTQKRTIDVLVASTHGLINPPSVFGARYHSP